MPQALLLAFGDIPCCCSAAPESASQSADNVLKHDI